MKTINKVPVFIILIFLYQAAIPLAAQKKLSLNSIAPLEPIYMNDTTDFQVVVGVDSALVPSVAVGDIFYYYITDSMINASVPPRILEQDFVIEVVPDGMVDTVHIDIRPDEIRTTPVNLIILWPAMIPTVSDTDSIVSYIIPFGYLGNSTNSMSNHSNVIFPCPAMQYLYITPDDVDKISSIEIISGRGSVVSEFFHDHISKGFIDLKNLPAGNYYARISYLDHRVINQKIILR